MGGKILQEGGPIHQLVLERSRIESEARRELGVRRDVVDEWPCRATAISGEHRRVRKALGTGEAW
jgi:hypothetical protein